jgi:cytochrome c biogenesis protein CcmG/thiol:disulfide interchange protein DsbE
MLTRHSLVIATLIALPLGAAPKELPKAELNLKDISGQRVRLRDYRGKVVVLNFWATWCGPCKVEMPWFMQFEKQYRDQGFSVLGVSMDDDGWKSVRPYITAQKINYRVVVGDEPLTKLYGGVEALPTTFLIDREGRIAYTHTGLVGKDDYEKEIVELLGGAKSAHAERGGLDLLAASRGR